MEIIREEKNILHFSPFSLPIILTVSLKIRSQGVREVDVNPFYQNGRMQVYCNIRLSKSHPILIKSLTSPNCLEET